MPGACSANAPEQPLNDAREPQAAFAGLFAQVPVLLARVGRAEGVVGDRGYAVREHARPERIVLLE